VADFFRWIRFNLWYFRKPPWDTGITPPELEAVIRLLPPGNALDLGCGTGTNLLRLLRAGWQVCGVDFALQAVSLAKKKIRQAGFEGDVRFGDVTTVDFPKRHFALVYDIGCFHSLDDQRRILYREHVAGWLVDGGTFLLYAHLKDSKDVAGSGITEEDVQAFSSWLKLEKRVDSLDRFNRRAAWLTYTKVGIE
jgi:SAM-dependent methyltransferase